MNQRPLNSNGINLRDLRGADETRAIDEQGYVQFDEAQGLQSLQIGEIQRLYGKKFHAQFDGPILGLGQLFTPVGIVPTYYQIGDKVEWTGTVPPPWNIPQYPFPSVTVPPYTPIGTVYPPTDMGGGTGYPEGGGWTSGFASSEQYYIISAFITGDVEVSTVETSRSKNVTQEGTAPPLDLLSAPAIVDNWIVTPSMTYLYNNFYQSSSEYLLQTRFDNQETYWRQDASASLSKSRFALDLTPILAEHARYFLIKNLRYYKTKSLGFISYYPQWAENQIEYKTEKQEEEIEPDENGLVPVIEFPQAFSGQIHGRSYTAMREDLFGYVECKVIKRLIRAPR